MVIGKVLDLIEQFESQDIKRKLASIARSELNRQIRAAGVEPEDRPIPARYRGKRSKSDMLEVDEY